MLISQGRFLRMKFLWERRGQFCRSRPELFASAYLHGVRLLAPALPQSEQSDNA